MWQIIRECSNYLKAEMTEFLCLFNHVVQERTELSIDVLWKLKAYESVQDRYRIWELNKLLCRYGQCITQITAIEMNCGRMNIRFTVCFSKGG